MICWFQSPHQSDLNRYRIFFRPPRDPCASPICSFADLMASPTDGDQAIAVTDFRMVYWKHHLIVVVPKFDLYPSLVNQNQTKPYPIP